MDKVMQKLITKKGGIINVITDFSRDDFYEELNLKTNNGVIRYNANSMFYIVKFDLVHKASPYYAIKYWIDTHHDERIRREYTGLKPWHLGKVPMGVWIGEEGKRNGRELTDDLIRALAGRYGGIKGALRNLTAERFEKEKLEFRTSDGVIYYDANSMFQKVRFDNKHIRYLYGAVSYWMDTSRDKTMRERYAEELSIIKARSDRLN